MLNPAADQKSKRQIIATIQLTCEGCDWIYTNGDSVKIGSIERCSILLSSPNQ